MQHTIKLERAGFRAEIEIKISDKPLHSPRLSVDLKPLPGDSFRELSIVASTWERPGAGRGRWLEASAGQCTGEIRKRFGRRPDVARLCEIWDRWHLNGMNAASRAQAEALRDMSAAVYPENHYDKACKWLEARGLLHDLSLLTPVEQSRWRMLRSEGIPKPAGLHDRVYQYGHAWLVEPLPAEIVAELEALISKPSNTEG